MQRQSGGVLLIVVLILFFISATAATFFIGSSLYNNPSEEYVQIPSPTTTPTPLLTPNPTSSFNPKLSSNTETQIDEILVKMESQRSGKQTIQIKFERPMGWALTSIPTTCEPNGYITNCAEYNFKKTGTGVKLTLRPLSSWAAQYSKAPSDTVAINQVQVDPNNSASYPIVRYYDNSVEGYRYSNAAADNLVEDAIMLTYNPEDGNFIPIHINLQGQPTEDTLNEADKLVASLQAILVNE